MRRRHVYSITLWHLPEEDHRSIPINLIYHGGFRLTNRPKQPAVLIGRDTDDLRDLAREIESIADYLDTGQYHLTEA